jgi:DNA end-binding protein Ku
MARPIWTGAVTFGLVSVPVSMYSATHEHEVSFHQFQKGSSDRIRYRRVNERTGDEVDFDNIVKGADVGGGDYVMLEQEELDSVAPGRSRSLEIDRFVGLEEIDPIYYQKTYYLGPGNEDTAKVYALLRDAMADAGKAAIGTLVMRGKEYLAGIRPEADLLILQTMYFADEVRDPKEQIDDLPGRGAAKKSELSMAQQLIDSMSGRWRPEEFRDTYTDRVKKMIKEKKKGKEITTAEPAPEPTDVTDLLEVLRQSVDRAQASRSGQKGKASKATSTAKKAAERNTGTAKNTTSKQAATAKKSGAKKTATKKTSSGGQSTAKKTNASAKSTAKKTSTGAKNTTKKATAAKKATAKKASAA